MSDTPPPAKPDPTPSAKSAAKAPKSVTSKTEGSSSIVIKASPINPAWATEAAKAYGFSGALADAIAEHLADALTKNLGKLTRPEKLTKIIKDAANECIGKYA